MAKSKRQGTMVEAVFETSFRAGHAAGIGIVKFFCTIGRDGVKAAAAASGLIGGAWLLLFWFMHTSAVEKIEGVGALAVWFVGGLIGIWFTARRLGSAEAAPAKPIQIWINGKPSPRAFQTRDQVSVANEVYGCLVNMGYTPDQAHRAIAAIPRDRAITFEEAFQVVARILSDQVATKKPATPVRRP